MKIKVQFSEETNDEGRKKKQEAMDQANRWSKGGKASKQEASGSMTRGVSELHFRASPRGQDKQTSSEYGQRVGERVALVKSPCCV